MIPKKYLIGIFLISLATLAFEVALVRLFSIIQFYHFAFMVLSIAMFGMAAAGTVLSVRKWEGEREEQFFRIAALGFPIAVVVGFFLANMLSFDPYKAIVEPPHLLRLLLYYLLFGIPFFLFGVILTLAFRRFQKDAGKLYCSNLLGSAIGSLLALPLIAVFQEKVILPLGILGLFAAACFLRKWKILFALGMLFLALFFVPFQLNLSEYKELHKALQVPNSKHLLEKWNSFSKVDVVQSSFTRYAPGLSSRFQGNLPEQIGITIDGGGMNAITERRDLEFLEFLPNTVAFILHKEPKVLVLNAGAGLDVLNALEHKGTVTASESNPIVIELLQNQYKDFSGNIYEEADVILGEGRNIIKQEKQYDAIILSLAGNVLSSAAGLSSLAENYLLTTEAFQDYYHALSENGILVITRWLDYPPREVLRLFSLALTLPEAEKKAVLFRSWTTVTLLLSKQPLDEKQLQRIKNFTDSNRFDLIYFPGNFTPNIYGKFPEPYYYDAIQGILQNGTAFYQDYLFDVTPVTDDRPFYFNFFKWSKVKKLFSIIGTKWQPFQDSGFLMLFLLIQAVLLAIIFILLPLKVFRKEQVRKSSLLYFFCIGLSYLFLEIVLIQKFTLFLGQSVYAFSLVLFAMLLFSGIGAYYAERWQLKNVMLILFSLILAYHFSLSPVLETFSPLLLLQKMFFGALLISPLAFFMGMPFPAGIRRIQNPYISWAWAINGSASVLGSILAVTIAMHIGYSVVFLFGGVLYILGWALIKKGNGSTG
ncbi:hypothetical protein HYS48_01990 [Candidatus Woesearchaeota archaeon]|nr:hypothetical protein [Candidatus Woesearchaeota archaeon]